VKVLASDSGAEIKRNTELNEEYETLMAEAYDQQSEVVLPPMKGHSYVCKAHEAAAKNTLGEYLFTIPVSLLGECRFLITAQYFADQLETREVLMKQILAILENVSETLEYKKYQEKSVREKCRDWLYTKMKGLIGVKYLGLKAFALFFLLALGICALIPVEYRVDGDFSIESGESSIVVSPIASLVKEKKVSLGDWVEKGDVLLTLNDENEILEYNFIRNKIRQYQAQSRKYLAERKLTEINQIQGDLEEAQIQLKLVESKLNQGTVTAPISGYIVEMYAEKQVNEPVQAGTPLFRIVSDQDFHVLLEVDERNLQYINQGAKGRIAFKNNPDLKIPIEITHDDNLVVYKGQEVRFINRAQIQGEQLDWFRDGMTGVCKVDAGQQSLLWVMCRRTYLYLRLKLWW